MSKPDGAGLRALLLLRALPGIGDRRFTQLLADHGSAEAALAAEDALGPAARARGDRRILDRVARAAAVVERSPMAVLTPGHVAYPARLRELYDPPGLLFASGSLALAGEASIAVIGSRRSTAYGRDATGFFAAGLARSGYHVISGLARGIDRAAHQAALDAGGRTIAVVGCGIDVPYPPEHARLQERIATEGLLLSEFLPGEPPLPHHFPRRNRIIAALSQAVLVVEAGPKSGAFGTVDHALDLGREVFAVPGPIGRESSAGTHRLIQEGASLVTAVPEILEELERIRCMRAGASSCAGATGAAETGTGAAGSLTARAERVRVTGSGGHAGRTARRSRAGRHPALTDAPAPSAWSSAAAGSAFALTGGMAEPPQPAGPIDTAHAGIMRALAAGSRHVDDLAVAVGVPSAAVLAGLLELELDGRVRQLPGMRFALLR